MTTLIFTFRNFVKISKNITAHTNKRPPLEVIERTSFKP